MGNKLELIGPILDGFEKEIGLSIHAKFGSSRMTGLMALVVLFMPFQIFRHLWVLVQGYRGALKPQRKERTQHGRENLVASKIFRRIVKRRHYEKVPERG